MLKERLKKSLARSFAVLFLVCFASVPAQARPAAGAPKTPGPAFVQCAEEQVTAQPSSAKWEKVGNAYRLRSSNGKLKTGMVKYKGRYYYFDAKGYMKCGFVTWNGRKYYASYIRGEKGKGEILTGLVKAGKYYYYLDPSSPKVPGAAATGLVKIGRSTYHFDLNGRMVTSFSNNGTALPAKFKAICQHPELPTGCEITSLTMVLNYLGYPADKLTMADRYLEKGKVGRVSFWEKFLGNPRDPSSYGCYAPVIVKAANRYLIERNSALRARYLSGRTLESLSSYTSAGIPVLIWSTIDCRPGRYTTSWVINGKKLTWYSPEHCLVLVGFRGNSVLAADPIYGKIMTYNKEKFRNGYKGLKSQTVVIR